MRRTSSLIFVSALVLAACGDSADDTADSPADEVPAADSGADDTPSDDNDDNDGAGSAADDEADQRDDNDEPRDDEPADDADSADEPATGGSEKPDVDVPGAAPSELVRTVLIDGTGEPATAGDTVIVDYVGVRSLDGVEFDNSYDRGQPFPVVLGSGGVIQGWEDGLEGALSGERVQLDIPADLAYGEVARGDIIRENEPLTFVIDVRSVVKTPDPSEAPTEPGVELSDGDGVEDTEFIDLRDGEGATLEPGGTAIIHFVYFRGDNGVQLESSWASQTLTIQYDETQLIPGLYDGMEGMQVGGRRAITVPPEDAFGVEGNPQAGLPAETDVIFVIDLIATY